MKIKLFPPVNLKWPISSPFGMRKDPHSGEEKMHNGIDFAVPVGNPVRAMADGRAFICGWQDPHDHDKGFGMRIWQICDIHGEEYYLWYGHLGAILPQVKAGFEIKRGQLLAESGDSGSSTGPHLHVQVRKVNTNEFYDMEFNEQEKQNERRQKARREGDRRNDWNG